MEYIVLTTIIIGFVLTNIYLKKQKESNNIDVENTHKLEKQILEKEGEIKELQNKIDILNTKLHSLNHIKTEKIQIEERLKITENERNNLKQENTSLRKEEENRNETLRKSIEATNTLQTSLKQEKERLNDERVKQNQEELEKMKLQWSRHEKDVEQHIKQICKNHLLQYINPEDFPHARNKPDNTIEIMDQLIIFDSKSPANDDLTNFPKYIKTQTENLNKYAKHENVRKELFLVVPANTIHTIEQLNYNIGDYNVFIITKDALEPIILSFQKIAEYKFIEELSPEERDNICRIIGKFAHTTKRRIQIDQFFAEEFLETLGKTGSLLPRKILESVIQFENAEKLNPPMEKRKKQILTKELKEKSKKIQKEIELREIPKIQANIEFKENNEK